MSILTFSQYISIVLIGLASCQNDELNPNHLPRQELNYNGAFYTVNANDEWAEVLLVEQGAILAIGTNEAVSLAAHTEAHRIDLKGKFGMPGIHDVHMHPLEASSKIFHFILDSEETDPENCKSAMDKALIANPGSDWLLGWRHPLEILLESTAH